MKFIHSILSLIIFMGSAFAADSPFNGSWILDEESTNKLGFSNNSWDDAGYKYLADVLKSETINIDNENITCTSVVNGKLIPSNSKIIARSEKQIVISSQHDEQIYTLFTIQNPSLLVMECGQSYRAYFKKR